MEKEALTFTIFLLKEDQVPAFDRKFPLQSAGTVQLRAGLQGRFIPLPSDPNEPSWLEALQPLLATASNIPLASQSAGALLVVARAGRTFVLTFGHAWHRLQDEWLERDFGRRVALNLSKPGGLLELRSEQVFAKWHIASERAPRGTTVDEFGVDFDRDLVGAVESLPKKEKFGKVVRGSVALRIALPPDELGAFLDEAEGWFRSNVYRRHWPGIDNLTPLKDEAVRSELDQALDDALQSPTLRKRIVMFTPTSRRREIPAADSFVYGRMSKAPARTPYLTISGWVNFLQSEGRTPSLAEAKHAPIHLLDHDGIEAADCKAYDCMGFEVGRNGRQYILSSGVWYEADHDFVKRVDRSLNKIARPAINLPAWDQTEHEDQYNRRCCANRSLLLFDMRLLRLGGGQSKFEFCDVFSPGKKTLVFAKIATRSSGMSHLVEQVRRTAELLFSPDSGYRKKLKSVFKQYHPKADRSWLDEKPRPEEWELYLASLGRSADQLPFFARCSLMKLHEDLRQRGHRVSFGRV